MDLTLLVATIVLALATVVLALFTWRLWQETKAARQPRIVASLDLVIPMYGELRIANAGVGVALAVDITFSAQPGGEQRRWRPAVVLSGEGANFGLLSQSEQTQHPKVQDLDPITELFTSVSITGTYVDVRGKKYTIDQTLQLASEWGVMKAANQIAAVRGPMRQLHDAVVSMDKSLKKLAQGR